eukprot:11209028-Lingulodinium_polyedra.AAC.1
MRWSRSGPTILRRLTGGSSFGAVVWAFGVMVAGPWCVPRVPRFTPAAPRAPALRKVSRKGR